MASLELEELCTTLKSIREALTRLSRLMALGLLSDKLLVDKRARAKQAVSLINSALQVEDFLLRHYQVKPFPVTWPEEVNPESAGIIVDGQVDTDRLDYEISSLTAGVVDAVNRLAKALVARPLLEPALELLSQISISKTTSSQNGDLIPRNYTGSGEVVKAVTGPSKVGIDPAFVPTYSLLQKPVSTFGDSASEAVPYFWSLAIRESLAAELCALSMVEYDGLPLAFYRDMAKQSWDEMRHATYFFDTAVLLLPELEAELPEDDPLLMNVRLFCQMGTGLPIPKERNLYEAILNANLVERLILLHRDTETPGIHRIKQKIHSRFCKEHPEIESALKIVMRDEITHASFGNVWLEYLLPDTAERQEAIENTELLRGVLLLASFAHHNGLGLKDLINQYTSGKKAPLSELTVVNR